MTPRRVLFGENCCFELLDATRVLVKLNLDDGVELVVDKCDFLVDLPKLDFNRIEFSVNLIKLGVHVFEPLFCEYSQLLDLLR